MRLHDILLEVRKPANYRRYFHGTPDLNTLHKILDNGLKPGPDRGRAYLGSLKMALAYGPYIVEVLVNRNDQGLTRDEDELAFNSPIGQGIEPWRAYFSDNPDIRGRGRFMRAARDYWEGGDGTQMADIAKGMRHYPSAPVGPERTAGIHSNTATTRIITTRGRTRIIAAYRFELQPRRPDTPYRRGIWRCVEVLYGAGSVSPGDEVMSPEDKLDNRDD
jgi:hypothetical protein